MRLGFKNRQCNGKQKHLSRGKADAHIRHLVSIGKVTLGRMNAYPCTICGWWHVGRMTKDRWNMERKHYRAMLAGGKR